MASREGHSLSGVVLRDMLRRIERGLSVSAEDVACVFDVLEEILDAAEEASGDGQLYLEEVAGAIKSIEEARKNAVEDQDDRVKEAEDGAAEALKEHEQEEAELRTERDEIKARMLELEEELAAARKEPVDISVVRRLKEEIAERDSQIARLQDQAERVAAWWEKKARDKVAEEIDAIVAGHAAALATERQTSNEMRRDFVRLRNGLEGIVRADPSDAHRLVRVLLGRELLEKTGTAASPGYVIPSRRQRKLEKLRKGKPDAGG